jgi:putative DNA primase/helicase
MRNPNLKIALEYAAIGWKLFPCEWIALSKTHMPKVKWSKESSSDGDVVRSWFNQWPNCYFCVALNQSDLTVIDIDNKKGKSGSDTLTYLESKYEELPKTIKVKTPAGGFHYYFKGSTPQRTEGLGKGIDTPGMAPLPGSYVEGKGTYELVSKVTLIAPIPKWITDELGKATPKKEKDTQTPSVELDQEHNIKRAIDNLITRAPIAVEGDGGDYTTYKVACRVRDLGISEQKCLELMLDHYNERCEPPWAPEELQRKVNNGYTYAQEKAGSKTAEAEFDRIPLPENNDVATIPSLRDAIIDSKDFISLEISPKEVYLDPWITERSIVLITGFRGVGKSWFALSILDAISKGISFGPWNVVNSVPSLYLDGEMVIQDVRDRIKILGESRISPLKIYSDAYASQKKIPRANLLFPKWRDAMKKLILDLRVKLFVIDNLASLTPGIDENSNKDWGPINDWLLELRFAGITTIMLHHTNKTGGQRGTSSREDNIDISIMLKQPPGYSSEDGAKFNVSFTKSRIATSDLHKIATTQFHFTLDENGKAKWISENLRKERKKEIFKLKDEGMSNRKIADEVGRSPQYIGKVVKKAKVDDYLNEEGKLTGKGKDFVGVYL